MSWMRYVTDNYEKIVPLFLAIAFGAVIGHYSAILKLDEQIDRLEKNIIEIDGNLKLQEHKVSTSLESIDSLNENQNKVDTKIDDYSDKYTDNIEYLRNSIKTLEDDYRNFRNLTEEKFINFRRPKSSEGLVNID